ncbi:hypothetical protein BHE74_00015473 [Ensete ventricosum]|nr:hypothetical protein BHE74_00015473 [Ensete ventricosum]
MQQTCPETLKEDKERNRKPVTMRKRKRQGRKNQNSITYLFKGSMPQGIWILVTFPKAKAVYTSRPGL